MEKKEPEITQGLDYKRMVLLGLWYGILLGLSYFVLEAHLGEGFVYRFF